MMDVVVLIRYYYLSCPVAVSIIHDNKRAGAYHWRVRALCNAYHRHDLWTFPTDWTIECQCTAQGCLCVRSRCRLDHGAYLHCENIEYFHILRIMVVFNCQFDIHPLLSLSLSLSLSLLSRCTDRSSTVFRRSCSSPRPCIRTAVATGIWSSVTRSPYFTRHRRPFAA